MRSTGFISWHMDGLERSKSPNACPCCSLIFQMPLKFEELHNFEPYSMAMLKNAIKNIKTAVQGITVQTAEDVNSIVKVYVKNAMFIALYFISVGSLLLQAPDHVKNIVRPQFTILDDMNIMILGSFEPLCTIWEKETFRQTDIPRINLLIANGLNACQAILEVLPPTGAPLELHMENLNLAGEDSIGN